MTGGFGSHPHSELDVPPGFGPFPKPSNLGLRRTATTVGASSSSKKPNSQNGIGMEDRYQGESSDNGSKRITRRRCRPQFLDPSPQPTGKRRGRPPGSGRKPTFASWFSERELEIGKDTQASLVSRSRKQTNIYIPPSGLSEGNQSIPPVHGHLAEHGIFMNSLPLICQHAEQGPDMKKQPQGVAVEVKQTVVRVRPAFSEDVHEKATASSQKENPIIADAPQREHEREGTNSPNNQPSQVTDSFLHHTANTFDDTGESLSAPDVMTVRVGSFDVNPSLAPTLQAIMNKHGDIAQNCPLESGYMRNSVLEGVCKVVQALQRTKLTELDKSMLCAYYSAVKDAQKMKLNVKWLHQRLDEIHEALKTFEHVEKLIEEKTKRMEVIENMKKNLQLEKVQLEKFRTNIGVQEGSLVMEMQQTEKLIINIRGLTSLFQHFLNNLMDGLL